MADDLSDVYAELRRLQERVRILETANPLEASSVTNGQIRIIGGTIRVDGGGNLIVNGTMSVNGMSTVTGSFTVSGPWNLSGAGTISGNVTITGNVTATGTLTQNGPWNLNGAGTIAGNVTQTGNTTQQGNVTLTGGGKITAGNVIVEPNKVIVGGADGDTTLLDSRMTFSNGSALRADSAGVQIVQGNAQAAVFDNLARLRAGTRSVTVTPSGVSASWPTAPVSEWPGHLPGELVATATGATYRLV